MEIRASDDDRQRVVTALERHTGAGRLTLDEFAERVQVAAGARTLGELAAVLSDLPSDPASVLPSSRPSDPASSRPNGAVSGAASGLPNGAASGPVLDSGQPRELLWVFAIAIATLILLGIALALRA